MTNKKYLLPLFAVCLIATPVAAQERSLTEAEITQLFDQLYLKEEMIVDTDDMELKDKQKEEIAEQILHHYTEDFSRDFKHKVMVEGNIFGKPYMVKEDRFTYKERLQVEKLYKNLNFEYEIKNLDIMGQRAIAQTTAIGTFKIDATEYKHDPKIAADAIIKQECIVHIKVDYDDVAKIMRENCEFKTLISNLEIDESDQKAAARYLSTPPQKLASYVLEAYNPAE